MNRLLITAAISLSLFSTHSALARQPRQRATRHSAPRTTHRVESRRLPDIRGDWRNPYHATHPRYIGGFHVRGLSQFGYPPGDIGFRGWAW